MRYRKTAVLAWLVCGVVTLASLWSMGNEVVSGGAQGNLLKLANSVVSGVIPIVSTVVGALIVSRHPRNVIGWLVMLPTVMFIISAPLTDPLESLTTAPSELSFPLLLAILFQNSSWLLVIFPPLFIALLFPTGSPPSSRWRWVAGFGITMVSVFIILNIFAQRVGPDPGSTGIDWTVTNPIGFIPQDLLNTIFNSVWGVALGAFTLLSVASLVVRFRRAGTVEKEQIKWLLYACGLFALIYIPGIVVQGEIEGILGNIADLLLSIGLVSFPIAIGIAILRYRLFDIDVIIRRTLTYALVTALLAIVFFGSVILLQQIFSAFTSSGQNEIVTVLSTLAIAALFVPVRNRIQTEIDKRFNRKKYDAQQVLTDFSKTVRDETDLEKLTARLVQVVDETMQPRSVSVWLKREGKRMRDEG